MAPRFLAIHAKTSDMLTSLLSRHAHPCAKYFNLFPRSRPQNLMGIAGMLINGWHSDRTAERHWHSAIPLVAAGLMFGLLTAFRHEVPLAIACLLLGSG